MRQPVDWVNPLIDTANRRYLFFSSACRPFGMVNLSPDTVPVGAWTGGYRYGETFIHWFSHLHAWQMAGLPVLPTTGEFRGHEGSAVYGSRFSHEREEVSPGYHSVVLEDYGIRAELTATDRVGFHRYTFESPATAHVLFDLGAEVGPTEMSGCKVRPAGDAAIEGYVENAPTRRRPKPVRLYFVAEFDRAFESFGGWRGDEVRGDVSFVSGKGSGAYVRFAPSGERRLQMKVALSYTSVEGARRNLLAECPHWDFDRVRADARDVWNQWLGRIEVEGGTDAQRTKFYTDLYHALLGRRRVSDADGAYIDNTGKRPAVRQIPAGPSGAPVYQHHNSDAFWGAQWSLSLLWSLAWPDVIHNFANTLVDVYKNGGLIPRGPCGGNYSFVMTNATSTPFLVAAYQKGIRSFDLEAAYAGMVKNHGPGGLMSKAGYEHDTCIGGGIEHYIERGFVPAGIEAEAFHAGGGTAQTLEYAYADWCLAQLAAALGHKADYATFMKRAQNYRNVWDAESGFMRPRNADGSWVEPFDPAAPDGFVEGCAWHYVWNVPHDVAGLAELMGGREAFVRRLDEQLERAERHRFCSHYAREGEVAYLDYGNQPCTYIAHLFNHAGAPHLAQKWVRRIMAAAKSDVTPAGGYGGDEDQGMMGSLNALMALGLFDVRSGCDREPQWEITSPVFDRAVIHLDGEYYGGGEFVIETEGNAPGDVYVQSATLNGRELSSPFFSHAELVKGGKLGITLAQEDS